MKILDLNLHGYHPVDQGRRWARYRDGTLRPLPNSPFYYSFEEIEAGRQAWLSKMAAVVRQSSPDILIFQEVAAGFSEHTKDEALFMFEEKRPADNQRPGINTVIRLKHALQEQGMPYRHHLVCRGNRGWWTTADSFTDFEVVRRGAAQRYEIVWPIGSNPYPTGIVIEGFGVLVKDGWRVERCWPLCLKTLAGEEFTSMALLIAPPQAGPQLLIVNVHLGYKLVNLEQCIALKQEIVRLMQSHGEDELGLILVGDFNACAQRDPGLRLFCPDLSCRTAVAERALIAFNNSAYQAHMTLRPLSARRVADMVRAYETLFGEDPWQEAVRNAGGAATSELPLPRIPQIAQRIDYLFYHFPPGRQTTLEQAALLFPENLDNQGTANISDHPGLWAQWRPWETDAKEK